jgi:hypothetical protein
MARVLPARCHDTLKRLVRVMPWSTRAAMALVLAFANLTTMVVRKRSRWSVETGFRDSKRFTGLEACQCWVNQAQARHVGLVFLTFVVLQILRVTSDESVGAVKERWQLAVIRDGEVPPPPLRACPPELRLTT